ncbi:MAG: heavy metal-responsive transcriptional regulator [Chloroflexi bacterium]|nr:heavy metal-responsive transcriptional regulator [Chloroflexota bacterium]
MPKKMKIGELAQRTGFTTKTIRYYEQIGLLAPPERSDAGYRLYGPEDVERLAFVDKAKRLGFSLDDIRDVLLLHEQHETPCVHVLALLEQKLTQVDGVLKDLRSFRRELASLHQEATDRLDQLPDGARVCGIIEQGVHAKGEAALAWLEFRQPGGRGGRRINDRAAGS